MSDLPNAHLHRIPVEVWLVCWAFSSPRQHRRLSLVCQLFRSLCLPFLLQHQSFDVAALTAQIDRNNWIDRLHHLHRTAVRLDKLAEGPHVLLVRSWMASGCGSALPLARFHRNIHNMHLFDTMHDRVITTFFTTLGLYQNLRSLSLQALTIDASVRNIMLSLLQLEDLTLQRCNIVARDGPLLRLKSFTISGTCGPATLPGTTRDCLRIVSKELLCRLNLHAPDETSSLITGFGQHKFPHLVAVSLQCPWLESLVIKSSRRPCPKYLPPDTIPLLRSLTAPHELVGMFMLNRPVAAVELLGHSTPGSPDGLAISPEDLRLAFIDIARASVPLRSLAITRVSPTVASLASIADTFPELRALSVEVEDEDDSDDFASCMLQRRPHGVDLRSPELCDAHAFDDLSAEDVSDTDEDITMPATLVVDEPAPPDTDLDTVVRRISDETVSLPRGIEVLRLRGDVFSLGFAWNMSPEFKFGLAQREIAGLVRLHPRLREVQVGEVENHWKRSGALWKKVGADAMDLSYLLSLGRDQFD
ncbi:hypothetical protein FB451DRAFT_1360217 [Mycena latifolia]|nr:hypothetical protein FB451DRAFT_1360217 [Mycena latifolia]